MYTEQQTDHPAEESLGALEAKFREKQWRLTPTEVRAFWTSGRDSAEGQGVRLPRTHEELMNFHLSVVATIPRSWEP